MVVLYVWYYCRNVVKCIFGDICVFDVGKIFIGEDGVGVIKYNCVDVGNFVEVINWVFCYVVVWIGRKVWVSNDYYDISVFFVYFGYIFLGGFCNVIDGNFVV